LQTRKVAIVMLALAVALVLQIVIGTTLPRRHDMWFTSPDEASAFRLAHQVVETGVPGYEIDIDHQESVRPRDSFVTSNGIRFKYGLANSYLLSPFALSDKAVFFAPTAFACGSTLLIFAIAVRFGSPFSAALSAILFGTAAPVLFLANFSFTNLVSLFALLGTLAGIVYARSALTVGGAAFLVGVLGLFRPEYWLTGGLFAASFAFAQGWHRKRAFVVAVIAGLVVASVVVILALYLVYGDVNPFVALTGSTSPEEGDQGNETPDSNIFDKLTGVITPGRVLQSVLLYALRLSPVALLGAAGLLFWRKDTQKSHLPGLALGLSMLIFAVVFGGNIFNTGDGSPLRSSYSRYFLPNIAAGCILTTALFEALVSKVAFGKMAAILVTATCVAAGTSSVALGNDLDFWYGHMQTARELDKAAELLPHNAIIIGDAHDRMVLVRPIMPPSLFPEASREQDLLNTSYDFLTHGTPLFLGRSFAPPSYKEWFEADGRFSLRVESSQFFEIRLA
jgi:hypothetical protein